MAVVDSQKHVRSEPCEAMIDASRPDIIMGEVVATLSLECS